MPRKRSAQTQKILLQHSMRDSRKEIATHLRWAAVGITEEEESYKLGRV